MNEYLIFINLITDDFIRENQIFSILIYSNQTSNGIEIISGNSNLTNEMVYIHVNSSNIKPYLTIRHVINNNNFCINSVNYIKIESNTAVKQLKGTSNIYCIKENKYYFLTCKHCINKNDQILVDGKYYPVLSKNAFPNLDLTYIYSEQLKSLNGTIVSIKPPILNTLIKVYGSNCPMHKSKINGSGLIVIDSKIYRNIFSLDRKNEISGHQINSGDSGSCVLSLDHTEVFGINFAVDESNNKVFFIPLHTSSDFTNDYFLVSSEISLKLILKSLYQFLINKIKYNIYGTNN